MGSPYCSCPLLKPQLLYALCRAQQICTRLNLLEDCVLEFTLVCSMGLIVTAFLYVVITVRRHLLHLLKELKQFYMKSREEELESVVAQYFSLSSDTASD